MICKNCNHYNKDTAATCRFCGVLLQSGPIKAEDFLKGNQSVRRSNSFLDDSPQNGEDFLDGNTYYKNNGAASGTASEQRKNIQYQSLNPSPKSRTYLDDNPLSQKEKVSPGNTSPKSKAFRGDNTGPKNSNAFWDDTDKSESRKEKPVSNAREAKEKTAVFQESLFNKKFTSTLVLLSLIVLVFVAAFSYVFIGKYNSGNKSTPSAAEPSPVVSVTASPAPSGAPIATTKPE